MSDSLSMLATTGLLGYGFGEDAFRHGLEMDLDFIAADAGSMDPGPHYLGAGVPFVSRKAIKRDIGLMLEGALAKGVPMLIGSAGGGGSAPQVALVREVIEEIAKLGPKGGKVLVPVPEVHGVAEPFVIPEFISELERIGMVPERITVYATHATNEGNDWAKAMLENGEIDVTLFTSSAEIFSMLNLIQNRVELLNRNPVAYMGGYTAKTGRQHGINVDIIPEVFSMPGVVEALEAYFRGK